MSCLNTWTKDWRTTSQSCEVNYELADIVRLTSSHVLLATRPTSTPMRFSLKLKWVADTSKSAMHFKLNDASGVRPGESV